MKLSDILQEARYAQSHPIVDWVKTQIQDNQHQEEWSEDKKVYKKDLRQAYAALLSAFGQPTHTWIDGKQMVPELRLDTLGDRGVYTRFNFTWDLPPNLEVNLGYSPESGGDIHITTYTDEPY